MCRIRSESKSGSYAGRIAPPGIPKTFSAPAHSSDLIRLCAPVTGIPVTRSLMMSKIAVFGAGSWGTAFSIVLADAGNDVAIWGRREQVCEAISSGHENPDYLPGIPLPVSVNASHDPGTVLAGAEVVVLAVPAQSL